MTAFLGAVGSFVSGLMSVEIPVINISMATFVLGGWLLYAVGYAVFHLFFNDGGDD